MTPELLFLLEYCFWICMAATAAAALPDWSAKSIALLSCTALLTPLEDEVYLVRLRDVELFKDEC